MGKKLNVEDSADLTEKIVNGYILHSCLWYGNGNYKDFELWEAFREDFEGWSTEIFLIVDAQFDAFSENFSPNMVLILQGNRQKIAEALSNMVNDEKYHEWISEEVKEYMKPTNSFFSRFNPPRSLTSTVLSSQGPQNLEKPQAQINFSQLKKKFSTSITPSSQIQKALPTINMTNLPPKNCASSLPSTATTKLLTDLAKIYQDNSKKYTGELYDILNSKLQIFYDCCQKVGLGNDQYIVNIKL